MTGMQLHILIICKLLLRPWDLSHRVERQKLMVKSREEMSVRVRKGGSVAYPLPFWLKTVASRSIAPIFVFLCCAVAAGLFGPARAHSNRQPRSWPFGCSTSSRGGFELSKARGH